jgi:glycosidase
MARIEILFILLSLLLISACGSDSPIDNTKQSSSANISSAKKSSIASDSFSSNNFSSNSFSSKNAASTNSKNSNNSSKSSYESSKNSSSKNSSSKNNSSVTVVADILVASGIKDSRLTCFKSTGEKACNLRTYQIMVEAFIDADNNANMNVGYGTSHHKGDLQGIINSLDYIASLGVNAIWLTPIFESVNNGSPSQLDATGYFASNYFKVDSKFGTSAQLTELITAAHAKGLYVFLDGVFGHFKNDARNYKSPSGKSISGNSLASFPTDLDFFKEVAQYWITNYKIDGWRLDQAYQVPVQYWAEIRAAVESASSAVTYSNDKGENVNPLGYMVAEIWKSESEIASTGYGASANSGLLSAFDFPLRYKLVQTLAVEESGRGKSPANNLNDGFQSQLAYPAHAMPNLMLGNHDLVRFGDLIQRGNLGGPNDESYWARHKAAISFMTAYSGPITLYYGDEIGQEVANFSSVVNSNCANLGLCDDHVARSSALIEGVPTTVGSSATILTPKQADLKNTVKKLMQLRELHPALWNGSRTHIYANANIFIDRKDKDTDNILYALNTTNSIQRFTIAATAIGSSGDLVDLINTTTYTNNNGVYSITLAPFEGVFLQITEPRIEE